MCSCSKKNTQFVVTLADGSTTVVSSEQEARTKVRIGGGGYQPKTK